MNEELMKKFKDLLEKYGFSLQKLKARIVKDNEVRDSIGELETIMSILGVDETAVEYVMKQQDPDFNIRNFALSKFFYKKGIEDEPTFRETPRYGRAALFLEEVEAAIKQFVASKPEPEMMETIDARRALVDGLLSSFNGLVFKGDLRSLDSYDFVFDDLEITDEEKVEIYASLIKGYTLYLREQERIRQQEGIAQLEEEIAQLETATLDDDTPDIDPIFYQLSEDDAKKIEEIRKVTGKYEKELSDMSDTKIESFKNMIHSIRSGANDLKLILESFNLSDCQLFLAYYINTTLNDIFLTLSEGITEGELDAAREMLAEDLASSLRLTELLKEIREKAEEEQALSEPEEIIGAEEEKENKVVFYETASGNTMFERTLKDIPAEKMDEVESMLTELSEEGFSQSEVVKIMCVEGQSKLYQKLGSGICMIIGPLTENHAMVYAVFNSMDISDKKISSKLKTIDGDQAKTVNAAINDGTIRYRELMAKSAAIIGEVKAMNKARGSKNE